MHELSIAVSLVELAEEHARALNGSRVVALHVRIGAHAAVVDEALRFSFDVAADGTPVAGARLAIERTDGAELQLVALEVEDAEDGDT